MPHKQNASETLTDGHRPKTTRKYSEEEALDSNPWGCDWWSAHPSSLTRYLAEQNMPNPSCKIWVTEKSWATGRPKSPYNPLGFSILGPGPRLGTQWWDGGFDMPHRKRWSFLHWIKL